MATVVALLKLYELLANALTDSVSADQYRLLDQIKYALPEGRCTVLRGHTA